MQHITVYKGTDYHSAFPEIIRLRNGDLVTVFRQAPARQGMGYGAAIYGERNVTVSHFHQDIASRTAIVRSTDDGRTWDPASLVVVDPADNVQDRNMGMVAQVSSGELIVNNMRLFANLDRKRLKELGGEREAWEGRPGRPWGVMSFDSLYTVRSRDNGHTWGKPEPFGIPLLTYWSHTGKTGVLEQADGTWLLILSGHPAGDPLDRAYLIRSRDRGRTWGEPTTIAYDIDQRVAFYEPPLVRLSSGRLVTVMRTDGAGGYMYQAFSTDDGWTWQGLKRTPIWGHPCNLVELRSGRLLCTYGYRRPPFGIRAAFSEDQGETWDMEHEVVIRDDGLHIDLGYPASIQMKDGRILSTYYFHGPDGIRYIGGSIWVEDDAFRPG